jgi:drug/metabolite transporter (DMT)-like permease
MSDKSSIIHHQSTIYARLLLTAVFWGGTFIAGRQVSQNLGPFSIAFLRFAVASVFLLSLTRMREGRFPLPGRDQIIPVILLGMTGIFTYNVLFFKGLRLIEAGRASLIVATCPAFIAVASTALLKERFSFTKALGIPLSVLGAIVVISKGHLSQLTTGGVGLGELFILGCVLSWVAYSLIGKIVMRHLSPLVSVSYSSAIGATALFVPALLFDDLASNLSRASLIDWTSIVYLAVFGTVIGFVWFYEGVKAVGPTRAGLFINFVPISAVILAAVFLHEQITSSLAIGAALVLSGIYLTNRVRRSEGTKV